MKKIFIFLLVMTMCLTLTACKEEPKKEAKWPEETFFSSLPVPSDKIEKMTTDKKDDTHTEYSVYVKEFNYDNFYEYITKLENLGFNYEFYENSVPSDSANLSDKTETSWGANNGKIWIRALWRSNENTYYTDYNLQLIFNNYDYLIPVGSQNNEKEENQ